MTVSPAFLDYHALRIVVFDNTVALLQVVDIPDQPLFLGTLEHRLLNLYF